MPSLNVTQKSAIVYFNTPEGVDLCGQEGTVVALTAEDAVLTDAAAIGKALTERGSLTLWHYAVRKATDGELEQAPREKISVGAQGVLRIEPYRTPLRVVAPAN